MEPFTLINIEFKSDLKIFKWVWDGEQKHLFNKQVKPQIWSASMTYDQIQRKSREKYWQEFLKSHDDISEKEILNFHHQKEGDLIIDRGILKTTSITQVVIKPNQKLIKFEDLKNNEISKLKIN